MEYRAVGNRCAMIIESLRLPISKKEALEVLTRRGFKRLDVNITDLARQCIANSKYRRGARFFEAPEIVDCSSLIKWLYAQRGIWLPRRSIQQRELGESVNLEKVVADDVIFVSGWINYYHNEPSDGVGHVGIATDRGTVIHAADSTANVVETPLKKFAGKSKFRGARRYIPKGAEVLTLETPIYREVEIADDIRWIILQSLPKTKNNCS